MAKKNLDILIEKLSKKIEGENPYRATVDTYEHIYILSKKKLVNQLYTQIAGYYVKDADSVKFLNFKDDVLLGSADTELKNSLEALITKYIDNVKKRALSYKSPTVVVGSYENSNPKNPGKFKPGVAKDLNDGGFIITLIGDKQTSIFGALSRIRKDATKSIDFLLPELRVAILDTLEGSKYFKNIMSKSSDKESIRNTLKYRTVGISGTSKKGVEWYKGGLFEGGHVSGYSVVEQDLRSSVILGPTNTDDITVEANKFESLEAILKTLPSQIRELGTLRAIVTKNTRVVKEIAIVFEQGAQFNNAQSQKEAQLRSKLRTEMLKAISSLSPQFWADFETSSSIRTNIKSELLLNASKAFSPLIKTGNAKVKVQKTRGLNSRPSSKKIPLNSTVKRSSSDESLPSSGLEKRIKVKSSNRSNKVEAPSTTNWLQLLPMINSRLPNVLAKNMNSPKLNFRTGRFAQSAKVVNVEQTREGSPSFVFDYERDPYDVFDRTLGRRPWNTPQRDPRALVDQSVREIVREMAIGRFFTRRA